MSPMAIVTVLAFPRKPKLALDFLLINLGARRSATAFLVFPSSLGRFGGFSVSPFLLFHILSNYNTVVATLTILGNT